jgi:hypothetical protein
MSSVSALSHYGAFSRKRTGLIRNVTLGSATLLMMAKMSMLVFLVVKPCRLADGYQSFRVTYDLQLQLWNSHGAATQKTSIDSFSVAPVSIELISLPCLVCRRCRRAPVTDHRCRHKTHLDTACPKALVYFVRPFRWIHKGKRTPVTCRRLECKVKVCVLLFANEVGVRNKEGLFKLCWYWK